jgi:hypothetical protein
MVSICHGTSSTYTHTLLTTILHRMSPCPLCSPSLDRLDEYCSRLKAHRYRQRQPALESRAWLLPKSLVEDAPCLDKACPLPASLRDSSVCIQGYSDSPAEAWKSLFTTSKRLLYLGLFVVQFIHFGFDHSEQARQTSLRLEVTTRLFDHSEQGRVQRAPYITRSGDISQARYRRSSISDWWIIRSRHL